LIEWKSPDRAEELIVVFNHNVINFILLQIRSLCMYTSYYDKVASMIEFSPVCVIRHFA